MVNFCAVYNCSNKAGKKFNGSFFRIPAINRSAGIFIQELQKKRREKWLNALKREDIDEKKISQLRICSDHFVSGNYIIQYINSKS